MDYSSYDRTATIPDGWIRSGLSAVQDDRRNSYPAKQDDRSRNGFLTIQDDRRNGYLTKQDDRSNGYLTKQDDRSSGYLTKQDDRPTNGFRATYGGTFYDEVPLPEEKPPPPGLLSYFWTIPSSYFTSWLGGTNETPRLEGGSSAGGLRADIQRPPIYNRGLDSEHSRHNESNPMPYGGFESREVNGVHLGKVDRTSPGIDDHGQRFPVRNEVHVNDFEVKRLENRIKQFEEEFKVKTKNYYLEKMRADDSEKELRECREKLKALPIQKVRADNLEKDNLEYQGKLRGLQIAEKRADNLERENREHQVKLRMKEHEVGELQLKLRAQADASVAAIGVKDAELKKLQNSMQELVSHENQELKKLQKSFQDISSENQELKKLQKSFQDISRENQELEKLRDSFQDLSRENQELKKLQDSFQAVSRENQELKKFQDSFEDVSRENQELKSWKIEQEKKVESDLSTSGLLDTRISELTTANGQLEKQKQQLTNKVQEQVKRIQELNQRASVLEVKMGAKDSESQSLRERLREERDKASKLSDALQLKNLQIEELMQVAQDLEQKNKNLMAQVVTAENGAQGGDRALKAQFSALQAQVGSKESETQTLKARLRDELEKTTRLSERLEQCDLEIDDLKHQIRDLLARGDTESIDMSFPPPPPPPRDYIGGESFLETDATPYLLDGAVQRVHEVAGIFARLLMKAMEQGKIDGMAVARNNFVRSTSLGKGAPLKYVLEAITCKLLFQGFEHECFELQDSTSGFLDVEQQRTDNFREYKYLSTIENPEQLVLAGDNLFSLFCRTKLESLSAAIPEIKGMVQEIISRTFEHSLSSDDTSADVASFLAAKLGITFVKLAVCVWQVHKLVFSFNPVARIFRISQSEKFVEKYMESVIFQESESDEDDEMGSVDISRVDFMVVPGFLINRIVIRSRVFVVTKPLSKASWIPNRSS